MNRDDALLILGGGVIRLIRVRLPVSIDKLLLTLALSLVLPFHQASPPLAVIADPPVRVTLAEAVNLDFGGSKSRTRGATDIVLERFVFTKGGNSGWHRHPAPVLLLVSKGRVELIDGACKTRVVSAGQAALERGPGELTLVRNAGELAAVIHVIHFVSEGTNPIWLDEAAPACQLH